MHEQPGYEEDWIEHPGFYSLRPYWSPSSWIPEIHGFREIPSGHAICSPAQCVSHTELLYPALEDSLRLRAYVWRKHSDDCTAPCLRKAQKSAMMELSGLLQDVSFRSYSVQKARDWLIHFLINSASPSIRERYEEKYPVTEKELSKMEKGRITYWFEDQDREYFENADFHAGTNWSGRDNLSDSDQVDSGEGGSVSGLEAGSSENDWDESGDAEGDTEDENGNQ